MAGTGTAAEEVTESCIHKLATLQCISAAVNHVFQ